jgi:GntR family transcriptional repressor for pyruvate dehydrogenase complex
VDEPPRTANIADAIFSDLRTQILGGKLKAGERLIGERELAAAYGTNRNTLREAVRKLEQARLVTVRHGRGVTVCDFRQTGTLELLSPYLESGPDLHEVVRIVEDVLAPRIVLIEYAARLAARRAEPKDIHNLRELSALLITAFRAREASVVASGFQRWLDGLIDAGHSVAVRWIANPFLDALRHTLQRFPMLWILEPSFPEHLTEVLAAIEQCDEDRAAGLTRAYYERVDTQLLQLLRSGIIEQGHVFGPGQVTLPPQQRHSRISSVDAGDRRGRQDGGGS